MNERDEMLVNNKTIRVIRDGEQIDVFPNELIVFNIGGMYVPSEPFGREYILSNEFRECELVSVKSLTIRNLLIHAIRNSFSLFFHKIKLVLYDMGFIDHNDPYKVIKFSEFTLNRRKTLARRIREDKLNHGYVEIVDYMEHIDEHMSDK